MIRLLLLILVQGILVISSEVFLKFALERTGDFALKWDFFKSALSTWQLYTAALAAIAGVVEWMYVLKNYELSQAYPLTAISFILSVIAGALIFGETITASRWLGVVLIMVGVFFIAK